MLEPSPRGLFAKGKLNHEPGREEGRRGGERRRRERLERRVRRLRPGLGRSRSDSRISPSERSRRLRPRSQPPTLCWIASWRKRPRLTASPHIHRSCSWNSSRSWTLRRRPSRMPRLGSFKHGLRPDSGSLRDRRISSPSATSARMRGNEIGNKTARHRGRQDVSNRRSASSFSQVSGT